MFVDNITIQKSSIQEKICVWQQSKLKNIPQKFRKKNLKKFSLYEYLEIL